MLSNEIHERIVKACVNECHHQNSGVLSVLPMYQAWMYAEHVIMGDRIDTLFAETLGSMVEPELNKSGFRQTPVIVGGRPAVSWQLVAVSISALCNAANDEVISPEEFYKQFEIIHPFRDGNGRVGLILFNRLKGTLLSPLEAPIVNFD